MRFWKKKNKAASQSKTIGDNSTNTPAGEVQPPSDYSRNTTPEAEEISDSQSLAESIRSIIKSHRGKGHLCFGWLCDMRTGSFAANGVNIAVNLTLVWLFYFPRSLSAVCSLFFSLLAIAGAYKFEFPLTGASAIGLLFVAMGHIIWENGYLFLFDLFIIYPTLMLTLEMYRGVIKPENYEKEEEYVDIETIGACGTKL